MNKFIIKISKYNYLKDVDINIKNGDITIYVTEERNEASRIKNRVLPFVMLAIQDFYEIEIVGENE